MVNFFLDDLLTMDVVVLIPKKALQTHIIHILEQENSQSYHHKHYSMIANPFSQTYQNSNQWVLEVLAAAQNKRIKTRYDAQQFLQQQNFKPQIINISPLKKLGAKLFSANVHFDDHNQSEKHNNQYQTISVRAIINYLLSQDEVEQLFEISEHGDTLVF
jgi:hypothetical protein